MERTLRLPALSMRVFQRALHLSARFTRPMTLGVRGIVRDAAGKILLVRHSYVPGWHLPGGAVEAGETVHDALARELREEGGIEVLGRPALHGLFFNRGVSRRDHVVVFVVGDWRRPVVPKPGWEIVETGFFPLDALPAGATAATRARLREMLEGAPVAAKW